MLSSKESVKKKAQRLFSIESILSLPSPKIKQKPNSVHPESNWVPNGQCQVTACQNDPAVPGCNCCCCAHSNRHSGQDPSWLNSQLHWPLQIIHTVPEDGGKLIHNGIQTVNSMPVIQRRTRRHRTIFTEEQLQALEETFHQNQYPDVIAREQLAGRIHLREERVENPTDPENSGCFTHVVNEDVMKAAAPLLDRDASSLPFTSMGAPEISKVWFKNRRAKWRRQKRVTASIIILQGNKNRDDSC